MFACPTYTTRIRYSILLQYIVSYRTVVKLGPVKHHSYIPLQRTTTNKLSVSKTTKAYSTLQHRWDYDPQIDITKAIEIAL